MKRLKMWNRLLLVGVLAASVGLTVGCKTKPPAEEVPKGPFGEFKALFPAKDKIEGWMLKGEIRLYLTQEVALSAGEGEARPLSEVMRTEEAEIYESYARRMSGTATYERSVGAEVESVFVWIHEMAMPEEAFGIFTVQCAGERYPEIGLVARQTSNTLGFVKGPYFVTLSYSGRGNPEETLKQFAEWIAGRIYTPGTTPTMLRCFPGSWRPAAEVCYLHQFVVLSRLAFVPMAEPGSVEMALGLSEGTEMAIVRYAAEAEAVNYVFVIKYPDLVDAKVAYDQYKGYLDNSSDAAEQNIAIAEAVASGGAGYLVGTLSAEEESTQLVIPQILEALTQ